MIKSAIKLRKIRSTLREDAKNVDRSLPPSAPPLLVAGPLLPLCATLNEEPSYQVTLVMGICRRHNGTEQQGL